MHTTNLHTRTRSLTRLLLLCGAIAGPVFILTLLIQDYTRPAYDPRTMVLSLLALGDWGWVQIANFALAGVLNLLYAVGLWRRLHPGRAGTWGPILIGAFGLGLLVVSIFRTDPANGFPPGAATASTWHGTIHGFGALFVFMMLIAALAVFARLFLTRKERGGRAIVWRAPSSCSCCFSVASRAPRSGRASCGWKSYLAGWPRPWLPSSC